MRMTNLLLAGLFCFFTLNSVKAIFVSKCKNNTLLLACWPRCSLLQVHQLLGMTKVSVIKREKRD